MSPVALSILTYGTRTTIITASPSVNTSSDQDDVLKQILVDKLIRAGEIDGYKRVGASCRDNKNFVRNNGESMRDLKLHIDCCLEHGDVLSFLDSFVYYDYNGDRSYNDSSVSYDYELDSPG